MARIYNEKWHTLKLKEKAVVVHHAHQVHAENMCVGFLRKNKKNKYIIFYPKGLRLHRDFLSHHALLRDVEPLIWHEVLFDHSRRRVIAFTRNIDELKKKILGEYIMPSPLVDVVLSYCTIRHKKRQRL